MKMARIAKTEIPAGREPNAQSVYIWNERLLDRETISERTGRPANKEYNIRVYRYPDGDYGVIAYYGAIGSNLQADWKGSYPVRVMATRVALNLAGGKLNKGYRRAPGTNAQIPGRQEAEAPVTPQTQVRNNTQREPPHTFQTLHTPKTQPKVQPSVKIPEPEKVEVPSRKTYEIEDRYEELIGNKKMKLVKLAQPNDPEGYKHTNYKEVEDFFNQNDMVAVNVGRDTVVAYKLEQRNNQWALVTQDIEDTRDPYRMIRNVRNMTPRQMNLLGMYDEKIDAIHSAVQNIKFREEFRPEEPEPVEPVEKVEVTPDPKENPLPKVDVNLEDRYEDLIGKSKVNWYKKSMSR